MGRSPNRKRNTYFVRACQELSIYVLISDFGPHGNEPIRFKVLVGTRLSAPYHDTSHFLISRYLSHLTIPKLFNFQFYILQFYSSTPTLKPPNKSGCARDAQLWIRFQISILEVLPMTMMQDRTLNLFRSSNNSHFTFSTNSQPTFFPQPIHTSTTNHI
jgi:hypothetical protein